MKALDKVIKASEAGEPSIFIKIEDFNEILTDERTHILSQAGTMEFTLTGAEIRNTGIYAKYNGLKIFLLKRDGTSDWSLKAK